MNRLERYLTEGLTLADLPTCGHSDEPGWLLWFGEGYGRPYYVLVGERHLEDALDEAVDYLAEHAPGLLADEQVKEEYDRLIDEGMSEEEAQEEAEQDTTMGGNSGHYVLSWCWGYSAEPVGRLPPGCGPVERSAIRTTRQRRRMHILMCRLDSWDRSTFEKRAEAAGWRV